MPSPSPVRAFVRSIRLALHDPHPYGRKAVTLASHKHDNLILLRRVGRTAAVYFPFYAFVLGWPMLVSGYYRRFGL